MFLRVTGEGTRTLKFGLSILHLPELTTDYPFDSVSNELSFILKKVGKSYSARMHTWLEIRGLKKDIFLFLAHILTVTAVCCFLCFML